MVLEDVAAGQCFHGMAPVALRACVNALDHMTYPDPRYTGEGGEVIAMHFHRTIDEYWLGGLT